MIHEAIAKKEPPLDWNMYGMFANVMLLCKNDHTISFSWIPRQLNRAAHALCSWALDSNHSGLVNIREAPPSMVTNH